MIVLTAILMDHIFVEIDRGIQYPILQEVIYIVSYSKFYLKGKSRFPQWFCIAERVDSKREDFTSS